MISLQWKVSDHRPEPKKTLFESQVEEIIHERRLDERVGIVNTELMVSFDMHSNHVRESDMHDIVLFRPLFVFVFLR